MTTTAQDVGSRYRLGEELGRGGMSTVYRAEDTQTGQEVAVKVYAAGASFDARARQHREAAFGSSLAHDGIVRLLDHGEEAAGDGVRTYLVTELVDGPTFRDRLTLGPCSPDEVAALGARIAAALAYLHSVGIVHRDVKPANVLLPGYSQADLERAKLADLGVAIRLEDTRVTVEGSVVGTATYLSPEQVSGAPITPASDIYSLGLMLIEALSGIASFEGSGVECALARLNRPPTVPVSTPQSLAVLLAAMTAMDPERRPDATAVAAALREGPDAAGSAAALAAGTAVLDLGAGAALPLAFAQPDEPTTVIPVVQPMRSRRWMAAVAGAAAVLVLGGFAIAGADGRAFVPPTVGSSSVTSTVPSPTTAPTPTTSRSAVAAVPAVKHTTAPSTAAVKAVTPKRHGHDGGGGQGNGGD